MTNEQQTGKYVNVSSCGLI